ncbi:MAG: aminoglycoside phosphotransferase family protein [Blautia sp.]|nr:aminoglycoside phosphotransferase family protein [Blautia sp.]
MKGFDMQDKKYLAVKQWKLDRLEVVYEHAEKAVFRAESEVFGPVILKIDQNRKQLGSEYRMLARLSGRCSCKVYAYDGESGLLLEERILPGTALRREASLEKRIQCFLQVFREIHLPADSGETYLDWLERICEYCACHGVAEDMASRARSFCAEMFEKYPDRAFLHGDLHHDNMLLRADGSYAMIDPKGVVGPAIMDLPRFILNELDTEHGCPDRRHIGEVIRLIGEHSGYPAADIRKLFYMETVLANVWRMEDGDEVDWQELELVWDEDWQLLYREMR